MSANCTESVLPTHAQDGAGRNIAGLSYHS
jgi:hypothetical protein